MKHFEQSIKLLRGARLSTFCRKNHWSKNYTATGSEEQTIYYDCELDPQGMYTHL